jgi:hypothetical protein
MKFAMLAIECNGLFDGGARFQHLLVATRFRPGAIGSLLAPAGEPIIGQTLAIHSALRPSILVAKIHTTVMLRASGYEPNPCLGAGAVLVITEEHPMGIRQHENCAGIKLNRSGEKE